MKILIEILHPAHVHFFRNAVDEWKKRGDEVLILSRHKDCTCDLLTGYGIEHTPISSLSPSSLSLASELFVRCRKMLSACRVFKPDILTGIMGVTIAPVSRVIRKPAVVFYDTENATLTNRFVYPMVHSVCTPDCYRGRVRGNHVTYAGYHELAYLHPSRFRPDPEVVRRNGTDPDRPYFILRLVSWQASHDLGETGITPEFVRVLLDILTPHGTVLISSEKPLPVDMEQYRFTCHPREMHHFLAFADILIGESATMASEAAVLGTPAFFISDTGRGYTDEEESRYGIVFNFKRSETDSITGKLRDILAMSNRSGFFSERRRFLLSEKADVTSWMIDYLDGVECKNVQHE